MDKNKVLVGLSWPYANGRLHIGHVGSSLPADVLARFHRSIGNDVSFITGSDCFGTPILVAAHAEGLSPEALVDKYHALFKKDFAALGFSFDNFTKTISEVHQKFAQEFHAEMYKGEYAYEKSAAQLYCEKCDKYLPDRYVEGVCPHCNKGAKGDSCDSCGVILEAEELLTPRCKLCGSTPVSRDKTQMYLKLSALQDRIQKFLDERRGKWPANAVGMAQRYLSEGLHDRAITRSMEWGVPVPKEGWGDKRIYVWAEAVLGYLSASNAEFIGGSDSPRAPRNKLHYYVHAKDNIPFHAIVFPGLLMAHGNGEAKYHLPDIIVSSEFVNINGQKMSKSKGNLVTAEELIDAFDVDMIRYYFLRTVSDKKDSNFTFADFVHVVNGELVNNFGNLVNRTLAFVKSRFDGKLQIANHKLQIIEEARNEVHQLLWGGSVNKALGRIMELVNFGNKHFADVKPWLIVESNPKKCRQDVGEVITIIKAVAEMLVHFIPTSCEKVLGWLAGDKLPEIEVLFKRLDLKEVQEKFKKYV